MKKFFTPMLWVLSLGYLIDFYDLTIFAATRGAVLTALQVAPEDTMSVSAWLFNIQALGIFTGGIISGVWGDKIGRLSAVRWGIFLYSSATILNVFATSVESFAVFRFLAGVGLAGELAASITYLGEMTPASERGFVGGTVYFCGVLGGILATLVASFCDWKTVYLVGGVSGYCLLLLRLSYTDSHLFREVKEKPSLKRGNLWFILTTPHFLKRLFILCLAIVPFWFMVYFVNFAPEIAVQLGFTQNISQHLSLICYFIGSLAGSYLFPWLAHSFASRKKAIHCAFVLMLVGVAALGLVSQVFWSYYVVLFILGVACGYPGLYMMMVAETFGTDQRSTSSGIISTCARTSLILINMVVPWVVATCGNFWIGSLLCAVFLFLLAVVSFNHLKETHDSSLQFVEQP